MSGNRGVWGKRVGKWEGETAWDITWINKWKYKWINEWDVTWTNK